MLKRHLAPAVLGIVLAAPLGAFAQSADKEEDHSWLRWRNRPSIQIGDVRLDLRLKLQSDWRRFETDIGEDTHDFRTHRAGVNGEIGNHVEFQIERDLNQDGRWRDVFANWRTFRQVEVMAGRFKVPFGREQLIGITDVDFAYRTLVSTTIPPARDKGVMVHGRFLKRGFNYEAGVFKGDGDNGRLSEAQFQPPDAEKIKGIGPSFAGRVTTLPLRHFAQKAFDTFNVGGAYGVVRVPEGLNSFRGTSAWGHNADFFEPVYTKGLRQRYGVEWSYTPGPLGFTSEWMQAREQRKNQGLGDLDLSDLVTTGWYASATWLITGEKKEDFDHPRHPLFTEGVGAIEVGARYEELSFASAEHVGPAFTNPRAENILGNSDRIWTLGVNYFPNRWVRLVVNGIHEQIKDPKRAPKRGVTDYWSGVFRLQLAF